MMTKSARIYVIYGQGGVATSMGMRSLANRIQSAHPTSKVSTHNWDDYDAIMMDMMAQPKGVPIILVGYSLGANDVPYIASRCPKIPISLGVCYDPSIYGIKVDPTPASIKRLLLYHNEGTTGYGHLIIEGPMVERIDVSTWHIFVDFKEVLHQKTLYAIGKELQE